MNMSSHWMRKDVSMMMMEVVVVVVMMMIHILHYTIC